LGLGDLIDQHLVDRRRGAVSSGGIHRHRPGGRQPGGSPVLQ
jgi:hypothetical protein